MKMRTKPIRIHRRIYFKTNEFFTVNGPCGKRIYLSKGTAKSQVKNMIGNGSYSGKPGIFRPYYCSSCDGWHIGHSTSIQKDAYV